MLLKMENQNCEITWTSDSVIDESVTGSREQATTLDLKRTQGPELMCS